MDRSRIRPAYPPLASSNLSTPSQSSSSLASMPSPYAMASQGQNGAASRAQSAPLPSPTTDQRGFLFGSLNPPTSPSAAMPQQPFHQQHQQQLAQAAQAQQNQQAQMQQAQLLEQQQQAHAQSQAPQQMQTGFGYVPDRGNAGSTNPETMDYLRDYNLVAEAAKRAQVACMIRDLDAMDMS